MATDEGAASAAPDPAVALVIPVIVVVDMTEFAKWHETLYGNDDLDPVPDHETAAREIIGEGVRAMRTELDHVDGISIGFGPSDLVDDAPDGL